MIRKTTTEFSPFASEFFGRRVDQLQPLIFEIIDQHDNILKTKFERILKDASESAVTLVGIPEIPQVCVKEFRWRGWAHCLKRTLRPSQAVRSFQNGLTLKEADIDAASPLALISEIQSGVIRTEWLIMEAPEAMELDRYLVKKIADNWSYEEKTHLIRCFGRFIGRLHRKGIFHSDLKSCNIMISESKVYSSKTPELKFILLDYDDVEFKESLSRRKIAKNLTQLFLSIPASIGLKEKSIFMKSYSEEMDLIREELISLEARVLEACRGRQILYVGFKGDIVEDWDR